MWDVLNLGVSITVAAIVIATIDDRFKAILVCIACSVVLVISIDAYLSHGQLLKGAEFFRALLYIVLSAVLVGVIKSGNRDAHESDQ